MPSVLTRRIFRSLIANENIIHSGCLRRQTLSPLSRWRTTRSYQHALRSRKLDFTIHHQQQRRTLFSFPAFSQQSRENATTSFDPGIEVMMDLEKRQRMRARLPEVKTVKKAIQKYLDAKLSSRKRQMPDTQAQLLLQSLQYVLNDAEKDPVPGSKAEYSSDDEMSPLKKASKLLWTLPKPVSKAHLDLAQFLYDTKMRRDLVSSLSIELQALTLMLCHLDQPDKALQLCSDRLTYTIKESSRDGGSFETPFETLYAEVQIRNQVRKPWIEILAAYARLNDKAGIIRTLDASREIELDTSPKALSILTAFYASRQDLRNLTKWVDISLQRILPVQSHTGSWTIILRETLAYCLRSGSHELGHRLVRTVMTSSPPKLLWDEILVWGFGLQKSIDEVGRMMDVMVKSNDTIKDKAEWRMPDVDTINRLVETAIASQDPYMAERLISLGRERGIQADSRTLVLQMQYRLSVKDVDGALIAYKHLQSYDLSNHDDVPAVNQLIVALCSSGRHDYDTIMNVAADLSDRRAAFGAPTVQQLALIHLRRDEIQDMHDLLRTHANIFSSTERTDLRTAIIDYCVEKTTPTAVVWDAYNILRNDFDEMPRTERIRLMHGCFARNRPDMAIHIFNHMRLHSRHDTIADASTYVAAFLGSAEVKDPKTLRAFHNQLKLDTNVDTSTRMLNALMIAYNACDQGEEALSIWDDIMQTKEGPTYNSIHIVFRACERTNFGDEKAQEIWTRIRKNNIELDQSIWASYIAALVGNGNVNNAVSTLEEALRHEQIELDPLVLGSLYNAAILTGKHRVIGLWASTEHPDAWQSLQQVGMRSGEYFKEKSFNVDRAVQP